MNSILRQMCRPKPTSPEPGSYIIKPSPAAADPDHHNNTVKFILKRVYGDTAATKALEFSTDEISDKGRFFSLGFSFDSPYFEKSSSIGCSVGRWIHLQTYDGEALLWDPSTGDVVCPPTNPKPPGTYRSDLISSCFGFDSASQDFKLIKFMTNRIETEEGCDDVGQTVLYSLKRDSWKDITKLSISSNACSNVRDSPAYVNGVCYWAGKHGITSFDFADERFSKISLPDNCNGETQICKVVESEGSVGVIVYPKSGNNKRFELWVLNESRSWARKWSVGVGGADMPLGLSGNGRSLFLEAVDQELVEYDLAAGEVRKLGVHGLMWKMAVTPFVKNGSVAPHVDGKADKLKAKMHVTKSEDFLFACADKWKLVYDGAGCREWFRV